MNDNKVKPVSNTFAVVWIMCEVGMFVGGIAAAISTGSTAWLALTGVAFALLMGGV